MDKTEKFCAVLMAVSAATLIFGMITAFTGCGSNGGGGAECGPVFQQVDVPTVDLSSVESATDAAGGEIVGEKLSQDGQTTTVIGCSISGDDIQDNDTSSNSSDDHHSEANQ